MGLAHGQIHRHIGAGWSVRRIPGTESCGPPRFRVSVSSAIRPRDIYKRPVIPITYSMGHRLVGSRPQHSYWSINASYYHIIYLVAPFFSIISAIQYPEKCIILDSPLLLRRSGRLQLLQLATPVPFPFTLMELGLVAFPSFLPAVCCLSIIL